MTEKIRCYCLAILFLSWSFCLQLSYFYLCNEDVYITLLTETVRLPKKHVVLYLPFKKFDDEKATVNL